MTFHGSIEPDERPAEVLAGLSRVEAPAGLVERLLGIGRPEVWLAGTLLLLGLTALLATPDFALALNQPSPRDFEAPYTLEYESLVATELARAQAAASLAPIYSVDAGIADQQANRIAGVFENLTLLRSSPESIEAKRAWVRGFDELSGLGNTEIDLLMGEGLEGRLTEPEWLILRDEAESLVGRTMRRRDISDDDVFRIRAELVDDVDSSISAEMARLVADFSRSFVVVNKVVDEAATADRRDAAAAAVIPQTKRYRAGQVIVRQGSILDAEAHEALAQFKLLPSAIGWRHAGEIFLVFSTLLAVAAGALQRMRASIIDRPRALALVVSLILALVFLMRLADTANPMLLYALPAPAVAMVITVLFGLPVGFASALILAMAAGYFDSAGMPLAAYMLTSSLAGCIAIEDAQRLRSFLLSGFSVAAAAMTVAAGIAISDTQAGSSGLLAMLGLALVQAMVSAGLTAFGVLAASSLFGVTTSFQLLELMRPDAPLLRELQVRAPGTYQHSVVMSNLAEAAANAIGADPLLVRTGAYYHDIGKMNRPAFFVENQNDIRNPHEALDPAESARIIIEHVTDGIEMAKQARLPETLIDFIREHHGTTMVGYFYHQAVEQHGADAVDKADFTYPGPSPRSRETAIVMLADGAEATVRARNLRTEEEIDDTVGQIIEARLYSGQLEGSNLTLSELREIRAAFVATLRSMYHPRIQYPNDRKQQAAASSRPDRDLRLPDSDARPAASTDSDSLDIRGQIPS